jgi:hypothetical protein
VCVCVCVCMFVCACVCVCVCVCACVCVCVCVCVFVSLFTLFQEGHDDLLLALPGDVECRHSTVISTLLSIASVVVYVRKAYKR